MSLTKMKAGPFTITQKQSHEWVKRKEMQIAKEILSFWYRNTYWP
jgi:hypothetical protein